MPKTPDPNSREEAPKHPQKTPPKSFAPKAKGKPSPKPPKQRIIRHQGR